MTTLEAILLASTAYFAWKCWRLSSEPMAVAVDLNEPLTAEVED